MKTLTCSPSKSKPCGASCISKGLTCRKSQLQVAQEVGAETVNLPLPFYKKVRNKYRANFARSASRAKKYSDSVSVGDASGKKNITLTIGGFSGDSKGGERLKKSLEEHGYEKDHHIHPISNEDFDLQPDGTLIANNSALRETIFPIKAYTKLLQTTLRDGYNKTSIKIAGTAYAYKQKYPNHQINLVGHSAGGIASHEAAEILESKLNIKTQVVAIGSPYYGITNPTEKTATFATKNDKVTSFGNVMNGKWINDVPGHGIDDFFGSTKFRKSLKSFLNTKKERQQKIDAKMTPRQQLSMMIKSVIERSYVDGIDGFTNLEISSTGEITGYFYDNKKLIKFKLAEELTYQLSNPKERSDAWLESYTSIVKFDRKYNNSSKRKQCIKGIPCGLACIAKNKTCEVKLSKIATPNEISQIKQIALTIRQEDPKITDVQPDSPDIYESMSIRELKKEASNRGVYRYSEMNSQQLKESIRFVDKQPGDQQNRLAKTVETRKNNPNTLRRFGVTARGRSVEGVDGKKTNPERSLALSVQRWQRIQRILKLSELDPQLAGAAVGAIVLGVSMQQYNRVRDNYRLGLLGSSKSAFERASKMQVPYTPRANITFCVGGYSNEGSTGEKLKNQLEALADKPFSIEADRWWKEKNHMISFDSREFNIPKVNSRKKNKDGTYTTPYLAEVSQKSFGAYLKNFRRGRNEAAVELAAQIYAHANYRDAKTGKFMNSDRRINIVAHATGGNTTQEALEIISRMSGPRSKPGREVLRQINVVTLGTTDFGFTEKGLARERNLTSSQDPFSFLPQRNEKWISEVRGHEIEDYLKVEQVQDQLLQAFGYYDRTAYEYERKNPLRRTI
jgi:hypothetical protein